MPPADAGATRAGRSRGIPRALLVAALVLLALRVGTGVWEARRPPERADLVGWRPIAGAEAIAATSRKPILYDFTADWCAPCQAMQQELFADERHARTISQLTVPVRVLDRQREEGRNAPDVDSLQRRFGVTAFPTLIVAWPGTDRSERLQGFRGAEHTARWIAESAMRVRLGATGPPRPLPPAPGATSSP